MRSVGTRQSEVPPFDRGIADPPLVRPREHTRRGAALERRLELPVEHFGLAVLAVVSGSREPDLTDLYYLGYCGGPVGTARLPYQLFKDVGGADIWGTGTAAITGVGTGEWQSHDYSMTFYNVAKAKGGNGYVDTVVVTATYN